MTGVHFLWHMHQPNYRPAGSRQAILPWVRLHAARGYSDLASVLEAHPEAQCTVNFSGILLEQLMAYGEDSRDYFAELSLRDTSDFTAEERSFVVAQFFSVNAQTLIRPHARYWQLHQKREELRADVGIEEAAATFSAQDLTDLLVWFNLAWIGFSARSDVEVRELLAKSRDYNHDDQRAVIAVHERLLAQVLPRYKKLADGGAIELSFTPYQHPILPLLLDCSGVGHRDDSDPLPDFRYAGDAKLQVQRGMELYERAFGKPPVGCWPAEGSVSDAALAVLADCGVRWAATDQANLPDAQSHATPWLWERDGKQLLMFFRDTKLSDNIGFDYASRKPQDAVDELTGQLVALGNSAGRDDPVVSVILDGENPWEAYPDGGEAFLNALVVRISGDPQLQFVTPSKLLERDGFPKLDHVHSGSWVGGNFDIWTKDAEARKAWRLLAQARTQLDGALTPDAQRELLAAEGSDWFWWYGDTFQSETKPQFDALFRGHLIAAYAAAGREAPGEFYQPILTASAQRAPEVTGLIEPNVDGRQSNYFEWLGAVAAEAVAGQGAMAGAAATGISAVRYGFSEQALYLRVVLSPELRGQLAEGKPQFRLCFAQGGVELCVSFTAAPGRRHSQFGRFALDELIEVEVPLAGIELQRGKPGWFWIELAASAGVHRFPLAGRVPFMVLPEDFELRNWIV